MMPRLAAWLPRVLLRVRVARPRLFSSSASGLAPGPTLEQLSPLLDRMDGLTVIGGFDKYGFNINGVRMRGSVLVFGNFALLWNAVSPVDVSPRALAPLHMVHPKPELVLVGTGHTTRHINPAVYTYMARHGVAVEAMSTARKILARGARASPRAALTKPSPETHTSHARAPPPLRAQAHAISTFNLLQSEGRAVAAALVSLEPVSRDEACLYTGERAEELVGYHDARVARALALDGGGRGGGQRLLGAGGSGAPLLAGAAEVGGAAAAPPLPRLPLPAGGAFLGAHLRAAEPGSYGSAGGATPAPARGAARAMTPAEEAQAKKRTARPLTEDERFDAEVARGLRRSGVK
jgi:uncharacterized protein